jgi:hypothetical protein
MRKKVFVTDTPGVIDIRGDFLEAALYLNQQPINYAWYAEVGTTWRYHIAKGINKDAIRMHWRLSEILRNGISNSNEFEEAVIYFSQFLKYGEYEFGLYRLPHAHLMELLSKGPDFINSDCYGGIPGYLATQSHVDELTIQAYTLAIRKGMRPTAILLHAEQSYHQFILDGHHKFIAYSRAGIPVHAILITKYNSKRFTLEESLSLARSMNCSNKKYLDALHREKTESYYKMWFDPAKEYEEISF